MIANSMKKKYPQRYRYIVTRLGSVKEIAYGPDPGDGYGRRCTAVHIAMECAVFADGEVQAIERAAEAMNNALSRQPYQPNDINLLEMLGSSAWKVKAVQGGGLDGEIDSSSELRHIKVY